MIRENRRNGLTAREAQPGSNSTIKRRARPQLKGRTPEQDERRAATAAMIEARTPCARCGRPATCFHEPLKRSRRRGSAYNPALRVPSCSLCNDFAEREHDAATAEDWLIPSWTPYAEAAEITARWLQAARVSASSAVRSSRQTGTLRDGRAADGSSGLRAAPPEPTRRRD